MTIGIRYLPKEVWADSESFCIIRLMIMCQEVI